MKRYFFLNEQNVRLLLFCYIPMFLTVRTFFVSTFHDCYTIIMKSWKSVGIRVKTHWKSVGIRVKTHWKSVKIGLKTHWKSVKI